MSDASPVDTVTTPVRPRPIAPSGAPDALDELGRLEQLVEVRQRMTPAASSAASVTRASPASEPECATAAACACVDCDPP